MRTRMASLRNDVTAESRPRLVGARHACVSPDPPAPARFLSEFTITLHPPTVTVTLRPRYDTLPETGSCGGLRPVNFRNNFGCNSDGGGPGEVILVTVCESEANPEGAKHAQTIDAGRLILTCLIQLRVTMP